MLVQDRVRRQLSVWGGQCVKLLDGGGPAYDYARAQYRYHEATEKYLSDLIPNCHHLSHEIEDVIRCRDAVDDMLVVQAFIP